MSEHSHLINCGQQQEEAAAIVPEPPQRELQDEEVGLLDLAHLGLELGREAADLRRMHLLDLLLKVRSVLGGGKVATIRHGIKVQRVQVAGGYRVPGGLESLDRRAEHGAVEALRLGVRKNDKDLHGGEEGLGG